MPVDRPNILLITTDQQRHDTVGTAAPSFMRTPHFDQLAREGVSFTSAYADCPLCVPARVAMMTGQHVFSHGMSTNGKTSEVMARTGTLPTCMRQLGYQTAAIGKMHFGPQRVRHGFDEMILPDDYYREMRAQGHLQQPMRHGLGQNELHPGMSTVPESQTLTNWTAQQCLEYLHFRRDPSLPFFLWCSFSKPHPPFDPPEPYYSMYRGSDIPDPVFGDWSDDDRCPEAIKRFRQTKSYDLITPEVIREARAAYYGLITQIDYNMGRVFAGLYDQGLFEDTLIIYCSDHGEYLGDHHTGAKVFFHEPSAHVPFVLRMPKSWDDRCHGIAVPNLVTHADILPTLVEAAGGTPPGNVEGQNLVDLARGKLEQPRRYLEGTVSYYHECEYLAITDARWKYIWYPEGPTEQLFDLATDPQELKNIANVPEFAGKRDELRDELTRRHKSRGSKWHQNGQLFQRAVQHELAVDRRNKLPAAGIHSDYFDVDIRH